MFWRGPHAFTGGTLVTVESPGSGNEVRGQRHERTAFAGRHDGADGESLAFMVDHADNPYHPPQWSARSESSPVSTPHRSSARN
ncbi:DUF6807 family protein [Glycomyces tenuis]|uniref:DUF6807 family protein n=1 Tax=Glycomyces tenuis TaxID=58116 RepID=UPI00316ADA92